MRSETKTLLRMRALLALVVLLLLPAAAGAVCPNTTETDEQTLWNVHNGWTAFRDWFRPFYNFQSDQWSGGWGWDSTDPTLAFPKAWDSAYLITYGLRDSTLGPWHSDADYYNWASGANHGFRYEAKDATDAYATSVWGWFVTDRVEIKCPSLNSRTAGGRAGTMLHESTHITYDSNHGSNLPGSNCGSDPCTDDWFFHYLNSYSYGSLSGHQHSMNQIQIEWLCDLSQFGESWVPVTTATLAQSEANDRMNNRIRNPPGWTCGSPRPIYVPPPPPPTDPNPCPPPRRNCQEP